MSGPAAHALFSASGSEGWMLCPPKLAAEQGQEDSTSKYAAEGTAAHELGSWCLEAVVTASHIGVPLSNTFLWAAQGTRAEHYLGQMIDADGYSFEVDDEMAEQVQKYVDGIRDRIAEFYLRGAVSVQLMVEVRVDYSNMIGQPNSFGTSDVIILVEWADDVWQIDVGDLKYGMGVRVYASSRIIDQPEKDWRAEGNKQMMMYALGAYDQYSMLCSPTIFSMTIYQPRLDHIDSFECEHEALMQFAGEAKAAAQHAAEWIEMGVDRIPLTAFNPGEKQCRWCKVGGSCEARAQKNLATMSDDFADLDLAGEGAPVAVTDIVVGATERVKRDDAQVLDALYPNLDEIDNWVKAVRGEIEKRALAGQTFSTCKLVQGKRGNRAWTSADEAEKLMKGMRLKVDQMYTFKLITPTAAEKVLGNQPKRWNKLKAIIGQAEGSLSVASINDKRPAVVITPPADDFDDIDATPAVDDFDDLA